MTFRRVLPLLLLAATAACAEKPRATGCRSDGQCAANARCLSGTCTADARPVAAVKPVAAVEAFALVELDGSASHDPDGRDDVAEHVWTVRAVEAACAPPEVADRAPVAVVRFGCPGRYEVSLAVRDRLGVESEPARTQVDVLPATGLPVVTAGPDLATDHVCVGSPFLCRTRDVVRLAASAAPGLALRWSVQSPVERPLDASRRVRFLPDAASAAPTAQILTDGTAISGDWIFRVEAFDAYGVVGAAHTRVSVRNRPPVVTFEPAGPAPHAFDAARSVFTSSGTIGWSVVDPDGDPVKVNAVWRHLGDGDEATFDGDFDFTSVTFAVEVPYTIPEDALRLRGGAELSRTIELSAEDTNRAVGTGVAEVEIGNRPPVPAGGTFDTVVPHRFDREGSRYVATARAGSWIDPDGDPLVDAFNPGLCGTIRMDGNDATLECSVPFQGVPALDQLAGTRTVTVPVRDPWDAASVVPVRTITILNSPPTLKTTSAPATVQVVPLGTTAYVAPVAFDVTPEVSDPDGDPVVLRAAPMSNGSVVPQAAIITGADVVPFHFSDPSHMYGGSVSLISGPGVTLPIPGVVSSLAASDGAATTAVTVSPKPGG